MGLTVTFIESYNAYILMGMAVLLISIIIMLIVNGAKVSKLSRKYRKFMRGSKEKNIEELIMELMNKVDKACEESENIKSLYRRVDNRLDECIQKMSMIRYKAFDDMGGAALSFSIAFLDAHDDGVILTGIYGRNECTTYAKPVDKGVPKYDLSDEEKHVLEDAKKKKVNFY